MQLPSLILGTANWGWTTPRIQAFQILETFLQRGGREIDTATNYPINRNPDDFRAAEGILFEFFQAHGLKDVQLNIKIGSLNNLRTPDINLSKSFIWMMADEYSRLFGPNLHCLMIHWDNRSDLQAIGESLEAFQKLQQHGIQAGLSGIAHPQVYARALALFDLTFDIQFKHNIFHSQLETYALLAPFARRFSAYGINGGGVKLDQQYTETSTLLARGGNPSEADEKLQKIRNALSKINQQVRPPLITMNHIGLIYSALHPQIGAILMGCSTTQQLLDTFDFYQNLAVFDYSDAFILLSEIN